MINTIAKLTSPDNPYEQYFRNYLIQEFPKGLGVSSEDLLEVLTNIILGTKEIRYGVLPIPEHLVYLRKIIKESIDCKKPLLFLVPFGSIKSSFDKYLDVAEIMAVKRIINLVRAIQEVYVYGVEVSIRVEDISALSLFQMELEKTELKEKVWFYAENFEKLVGILSIKSDHIYVTRESNMPNKDLFDIYANSYKIYFYEYLQETKNIVLTEENLSKIKSYQTLKEHRWAGVISHDQRNHYIDAYKKLYTDWSEEKMLERLALYFAGSLARKELNMKGNLNTWTTKYIQLAFVPPIKGIPIGYNYNVIYYRTLPLSCARTHIPAWRAKGYFKINDSEIMPKLISWNEKEFISQLIPGILKLESSSCSIDIKTDYFIEA